MNKNGVKLLAAVMVFAMAFAGAVVLIDSEDSYAATGDVAQVGEKPYPTIQDAIDSITNESEDKTIKLLNNTTVTAAITFGVDGITLDGNGKTITAMESEAFNGKWEGGHQGENYILNITKSVTIKDLTVNCDKKAWGINISGTDAETTKIILDNVECDNAVCAGFVLGHAAVEATDLTVSDAVWGGINVDKQATLSIENLDGVGSIYSESSIVPTFTDEDYEAPYKITVGETWVAFTDNADYISKIIAENDNKEIIVNINAEKGKFTLDAGVVITKLTVITVKDAETNNTAVIENVTVGADGLSIARGSIVITGSITASDAGSAMSGDEDVVFRNVTVTGEETVTLTGDIRFEGTVSIPSADVSGVENLTIAEDASVDVPGITGIDSINFADGATIWINNLDYTIYNKTLGTSMGKNVKFTIGIAIKNPTYDNEHVSLRDVSPEVILLNATVVGETADSSATSNARFDAALTEFVGDAPVNVNDPSDPYRVIVAVELNYSSGTYGNVSNYFYPTALFNIVSPEADIELDMDGWNVNIGYDETENAPHFTYKLEGYTFTDATTDLPFSVQFFLKDTNGELTPQSEWNSLPADTYTLVTEFGAWNEGNYAACTEILEGIELTDGTVESEMTFDEIEAESIYGKPVYRLQDGITVIQNETEVTITGTVYFLQSYVGFWGEADDKPGYYIAFDATALRLNDNSTIVITGNETKTITGTVYDNYLVLYLGEEAEELTRAFTIEYDVDGEGTLYTATTYDIILPLAEEDPSSSNSLIPSDYVYKLILSDERNATREIEVKSDSDLYITTEEDVEYLMLPSTAGGVEWITETGVTYAPAALVKITDDLDVNDDGKIVFTANYGTAEAVLTDIIVDAQTEYTVGDAFTANVYAIYNDGSYVALDQGDWNASMNVFNNSGDYTVVVTYGTTYKNIEVIVNDEPVEPTVEYSTDIAVSTSYSTNTRLVISLAAVDEKTIHSGTLVITGKYVVETMDPVLGIPIAEATDFRFTVEIAEGQTFCVIYPEEQEYIIGMISLDVTFESNEMVFEADHQSYNYVAPVERA